MITLVEAPTIVKAAGNKPKQIEAGIATRRRVSPAARR